jgi:hypothetical protein
MSNQQVVNHHVTILSISSVVSGIILYIYLLSTFMLNGDNVILSQTVPDLDLTGYYMTVFKPRI